MTIDTLIWLIPVPPLIAFGSIVLFTNRSKLLSHSIAVASVSLSWLGAMIVFFRAIGVDDLATNPFASQIDWMPIAFGTLQIGVMIDPLSAVCIFFVAWTVLMIFIYSIGYHNFGQPEGDHDHPGMPPHGVAVREKKLTFKVMSIEPMYSRFFALISLFAFAMYLLVVSDNLLTLYIGWEVMGFCSYMLIGFWYAKPSARDAAVKAFLTTRVGDVFMLLGIVGLYKVTGTLNFQAIMGDPLLLESLAAESSGILGLSVAGLLGILIFIGVVGKSAQFPLHVWLPDAMEGPTPVSAMIHAATMVSAGVYLAARIFPLVSAGWDGGALTPAMFTMTFIGAFTAFFAATIALVQNDIKRVLAYSTISQLGYMIAALGVGAYTAAVFHLVTHAFFKALLFLGSGSVIHGMENGVFKTKEDIDPQNMFTMGGLRTNMPVTFWTFLIGGLALSGFPLVSAGFWSKDAILSGVFGSGNILVYVTLALAALMTAFYCSRQITLTFLGEARSKSATHAHENKSVMTVPLIVLAVFSITLGWAGIANTFPILGGLIPNWFEEFVGSMVPSELPHPAESIVPLITSLFVSLAGLWAGWQVYRQVSVDARDPLERLGFLYKVFKSKYGIDEFYHDAFVRPSIWLSEVFTYKIIDKMILDGMIDGVGRGALRFGIFLREKIDIPLWNKGMTDGTSSAVRKSGEAMRPMQSGRVQQYMVATITMVVLAGLVIFYFFA